MSAVTSIEPSSRILVVDDEPTNVFVLSRLLKHCGLECEIAVDGAEAVDKALETRCDVILMDISMPRMDGVTAALKIVERMGAEAPAIIAVTANVTSEQRRRCDEAGFAGFIGKPVRIATLQEALKKVNERS